MCPYSLDREELANYCYEVFKVRAEQVRTTENPACGRSLKTQQHAAGPAREARSGPPGSVDISSPDALRAQATN